MIKLFEAARSIQDELERRQWPYCFIGGLAVARWGETRVTRDADLTLFVGFGDEAVYVDALLGLFPARMPGAREFALENRVLLLRTTGGVDLDIGLGGLPYEAEMIRRSSTAELAPGVTLRTCSAEDLVVLKAFAARDRDWADIRGIASRQAGCLDWPAIYERLAPLVDAKGEPEITVRLQQIEQGS